MFNIHIHNKMKLWYHYTIEYYSFFKSKNLPATCNNMNELGGHHAKGNKPDIERRKLHDLTYL